MTQLSLRSGGRDLASTASYPLAFGHKVAELHRAWVVWVSDLARGAVIWNMFFGTNELHDDQFFPMKLLD